MKKALTLVLALLTVLSSTVLAAPVAVSTVESADELVSSVPAEQAVVSSEEDNFDIPEGSKLVFNANFNDTTVGPNDAAVDTIGEYGEDFVSDGKVASIVKGTADNDIYFTGNGTLSYSENALSLAYTLNDGGRSWPIIRAKTNSGYFVDGIYTLCAEFTVPENDGLDALKYTWIVNGNEQHTPDDVYKVTFTEGEKNYASVNVYVYSGMIYGDTPLGQLSRAMDVNSVNQIGFLLDATGTAGTNCNVIIDNFSMYYQPYDKYFTAPEGEAEGSDLVFHTHFNNSAVTPLGENISNFGTYGKQDVVSRVVSGDGEKDIKFSLYETWNVTTTAWGTSANSALTTDDDELLIASTFGSNVYPALLATVNNGSYFADGKYTFFTEYYIQKGENLTGVAYTYFLKYGDSYHTGSDEFKVALDVSGKKAYISLDVFVYEGCIYIYDKDGDLKNVGSFLKKADTAIGMLFHLKGNGASATTRIYLDNLRMYHQPLECAPTDAVIKFSANGKDVENLPETVTITKGTYAMANAGALSDVGTARFVGWATSENGKIVETETVDIQENTTFYAIWDENGIADSGEAQGSELVFDAHFNNLDASANDAAINTFGTYGSGLSEAVVGTDSNVYLSLQSATAKWGTDVNANLSKTDDEFIVEKDINGEAWPIFVAQTKNGSVFADGKYTLALEVSIADNETIDWFKYSYYVKGKIGGNDTYHTGDDNFKTNLSLGGKKNYITMELFLHDDNLYAYKNNGTLANIGKFDNDSVFEIGFLFNPHSTASSTCHISVDNFRMYYSGIYKPVSYDENSIRVDDPQGIRFKASVTDFVRNDNELEEYGFVVTRSVILNNLGVKADDFTMENPLMTKGTYVQGVTKGMEDGKPVDRIFATEGINTFFTAVVYNIPADKYRETIVVRPYVKIGDQTIYGDVMEASIYEVAERISKSENYDKYKSTVDKILNGEAL